ncbi:MAG TPA: type II secretion system F family protein [Candidatus Sulfopaludibacter sp.]|jgi:tight adherence protein B|nr:type II secretion system F family protein [Candidatus Sulfopaludibacter sp.]
MSGLFLVAMATAILTYSLLWARLERRDTRLAVRRLTVPATQKGDPRRGRPRLIEVAGEVRGRLTGRLLERFQLRESAAHLLESAALKWGPAGLLHRSIVLFLAGFLAVTAGTGNTQPLAALAAGVAAGLIPLWYVRRKARARVNSFEEQFPDCLEFISRSMRAGHAFSVAVEMAHREFSDPLAGELRRAFEEQNLGQPLEIVLRKLSQRVPSMDVQFFVSAVLLQKRTGGNLAELLDKLANLMRERFKLRARIRAVSAQGLMSGRILSAIPAGVGLMMFLVNPRYARFFVDDPAGHELLAAGLGLQFVGYLIIKKIVSFEV